MNPVSRLPEPSSRALITEEAQIAAQLANLPDSPNVIQKMAAAVVAQAARDILLGKVTWTKATDASKVARDFVAIAKDLQWEDEAETMKKAETADDRREAFDLFRQRAQQNMKNSE